MASNTIHLAGEFEYYEGLASGAIKPGHLCEQTSATADTFKVHATSAGWHDRLFAVEDALQGDTVADSYSAGALVPLHAVQPGGRVQAWLKAGQNVTKGDRLMSAGDGTLIAVSGSEKQQVAVALESLDLSATGAVDTLIDVRVL